MAAVYPQLGEVEVEHVWSGVLGNALHRMPQIGELSPGLWLASAFGGHGLNTTAMAGNILAQAIVEGDDTWRLFAPFELVWAGGRLGRAAMQVYYWWFNARERFEARAARQREEEYRRVAERAALRAGEERRTSKRGSGRWCRGRNLPEEPASAALPADPIAPEDDCRAARSSARRRRAARRRATQERFCARRCCPTSPSSRTIVRGRPCGAGASGDRDAAAAPAGWFEFSKTNDAAGYRVYVRPRVAP